MEKSKILIWFFITLLISSCLKVDNETLVLNQINKIDEVIPVEYRVEMEQYMPFYNGETPPNIEGVYLVSKDELVYSSDGQYSAGEIFADIKVKFSNQDEKNNILLFADKQGSSVSTSDSVFIIGSGNDFTAYFIATGKSSGIYTKTATVISGTLTSSGIENYYKGFVMLGKGSDLKKEVIDVGTFRIFTDGDNKAENSVWSKSTEIFNVNNLSEMAKNPSIDSVSKNN